MDIRQFRVVLRARNFERTTRFYGEVLALPRVQSWEGEDLRGVVFQAGSASIEVLGRPEGVEGEARDEAFDYQGPDHKLSLTLTVPSAEKTYEDLLFREKNIPGGLSVDHSGARIFGTHDPDGVKIVFREAD